MVDLTRVLAECLALTYPPSFFAAIKDNSPENLQALFTDKHGELTEYAEVAIRPMAQAAFEHVDWTAFLTVYRQVLDQIARSGP